MATTLRTSTSCCRAISIFTRGVSRQANAERLVRSLLLPPTHKRQRRCTTPQRGLPGSRIVRGSEPVTACRHLQSQRALGTWNNSARAIDSLVALGERRCTYAQACFDIETMQQARKGKEERERERERGKKKEREKKSKKRDRFISFLTEASVTMVIMAMKSHPASLPALSLFPGRGKAWCALKVCWQSFNKPFVLGYNLD